MGLLVLLLITGLLIYLIWYLFFRSVLWVCEPLIEYMKDREAERFAVKDIEKDELEETDLEEISKSKVEITITSVAEPIHIPKAILQKAQKEPQKLPKAKLWVYKNYIFSSMPTKEKIKERFG